jgi:hypothetical protein
MNEMELLTRLRAEVPHGVSPRAEHLFRSGMDHEVSARRRVVSRPRTPLAYRGPARRRDLRPAWRFAVLGPLIAGLAAVVVLVSLSAQAPSGPAAVGVRLLADRAAAAALSRPAVSPGQWIYRKYTDGKASDANAGWQESWSTADGTSNAVYFHGTLLVCTGTRCTPAEISGQHVVLPQGMTFGISYRVLASMPADPKVLAGELGKYFPVPCPWTASACTFQVIGQLIRAYDMFPAVTAKLFQALGDVPGVTVVRNVTDLAGRSGVAFRLPVASGYEEIILNPATYRFMAWESAEGPGGLGGTAIVQEAPVSGPGVRP